MSALILIVALTVGGLLAFLPQVRDSRGWRATVTPLASIMGSGFLVSAPLLVGMTGSAAPLAMTGLLIVSYGVGAVIRFNIRFAEPQVESDDSGGSGASENEGQNESESGGSTTSDSGSESGSESSSVGTQPGARLPSPPDHRGYHGHLDRALPSWIPPLEELERVAATRIEQASHLVLAGAYLVSVTYYLQLLGVFVLSQVPAGVRDHVPAAMADALPKVLTTAVLLAISLVGWGMGLGALERVERYAVALNFGVIVSLIVGLAVHDVQLVSAGTWSAPPFALGAEPVHVTRSLMGLLIIVQGFETSRFLGEEHPAKERIATMRYAQWISAAVYLSFITLSLGLFTGSQADVKADVTQIVQLVHPVAVVLPLLIVIVAGASQFSAAVADDAGCAGLVHVMLGQRLGARAAYPLIGVLTIALTWGTNVLQIISLASRAFAVFYALQCGVAFAIALERPDGKRRLAFAALCATIGLLCAAIAILGIPAE